MKNIKWGCIQPLTGGMYIGALEAVGHDAEWILSYDGLTDVKYDKNGEITVAGNEYNLLDWMKRNGHDVPYYVIKNRKMFDQNVSVLDPYICLNGEEAKPDYNDLDLVVAVPVCSGLSMSTRGKEETLIARNCNMEWLAFYTLNVIKPKIYIFENAPTLIGSRGDEIRNSLEQIAYKAKYSVLYYKTDTMYHHNCQKRPRTFVIFMKWEYDDIELPYTFNFEHETISVPEFFDKISPDASMMKPVTSKEYNYMAIAFLKHKYGENWMDDIQGNLIRYLYQHKLFDEFRNFIYEAPGFTDTEKQRTVKYIDHIDYKLGIGMNYYGNDVCLFKEVFPSVQFKNIPSMLHYSGKRFCTIREYLSLMGMPEDFILYGNESNWPKIGQNVPAGTAKFIVEQAINVIENWGMSSRDPKSNVIIQDNIKKKTIIC